MVNALALEADEGRDEQRYASGRRKYLWSGDFRMGEPTSSNVLVSFSESIAELRVTWWTETSK